MSNVPAVIEPGEIFPLFGHDGAEVQEAYDANVGEGGFLLSDLDQIKIPSGGGVAFEVYDAEGADTAKDFLGIIVHQGTHKAYWAESFDDGGGDSPPDCYSVDGKQGIANTDAGPGIKCADCEYNQYESAAKGRGKACKDTKQLLVLRQGSFLPARFSVPPSSLKAFRKYNVSLLSANLPYFAAITRFSLESAKNEDGIKFARVVFSLAGRLDKEQRAVIKEVQKTMKDAVESLNDATRRGEGLGESAKQAPATHETAEEVVNSAAREAASGE